MDLREPKKKRVGTHIKPQQPFPILIESESGFPVDGELWPLYIGNLIGDNVIVYNREEMMSLYTMGFFGKGSFSRGYPSFSLTKKGVPPIIKERQWQRRSLWIQKIKKTVNVSPSHTEKQSENVKSNLSVQSYDCKISDNACMEVVIDESVTDRNPNINVDIKEEVESVENKIQSGDGNEGKFSESKSESVGERNNSDFTGSEVLVLDDSDIEDVEKVIRNPKPHIEVEPFNTAIETLNLTLEEAFFLSYALGCLQVVDITGELLSINQMWQSFCELKPDFIESYVAYHYFRAKGWVVKSGYKFGGDFLLYKQGPPFYHASCVVLVEKVDNQLRSEKKSFTWTKLHGLNRLAENSGKDIVICQVVFPNNLTPDDLKAPRSLPKFQVNEMLMKRWISSQERTESKEV